MSDVLTLICEHKRDHVAARKKVHPPDRVKAAAREAPPAAPGATHAGKKVTESPSITARELTPERKRLWR